MDAQKIRIRAVQLLFWSHDTGLKIIQEADKPFKSYQNLSQYHLESLELSYYVIFTYTDSSVSKI